MRTLPEVILHHITPTELSLSIVRHRLLEKEKRDLYYDLIQ